MDYGVLKGRAKKFTRDDDSKPHSELWVEAAGVQYRIAINVRSDRGPARKRLVEYLVIDELRHAVIDQARKLPAGWNDLNDGIADGAAIDYVRSNMFRAEAMKPLIHDKKGPDNDLFEKIEALLQRAIDDQDALVYAFGGRWGPEPHKPDEYFHFLPGNGVHLIHMNQGDSGGQNGSFQDGALLIDFTGAGAMSGLFIKFQSQVWHTDDDDGLPLPNTPHVPVLDVPPEGPIPPWEVLPDDSPYHLARIVGALVNPRGDDPRKETVTLFNTSARRLELAGWKIVDVKNRAEALDGAIDVGEARTIRLSGNGAQLSNDGGTITLLDARGLKVDGVAYTKGQAKRQGAAIAF